MGHEHNDFFSCGGENFEKCTGSDRQGNCYLQVYLTFCSDKGINATFLKLCDCLS